MKFLSAIFALSLLPALPSQAADFNLVGREMSEMLIRSHYARLPFSKDLSARIFDDFLQDLDPDHLYFTKKDVSTLSKKYRRKLNRFILEGKAMEPARDIFSLYSQRVKERIAVAQDLLKNEEFTFDGDRSVPRDREETSWPKDDAEAAERWKLEIESRLLSELIHREDVRKRAKDQDKEDPFIDQPDPRKTRSLQYKRVLQNIETFDEEDIANAFFSSIARAHDPHTEYFSARETDQFYSRMSNKLVGIGATLVSEDDGTTRITGIITGGPADRDGELELDNRIIAVAPLNQGKWVDTRFMPIDKVIELIKGEPGTAVGLRIEADEPHDIDIPRGLVKIKSDLTTSEIISFDKGEKRSKIGLLNVPSFYFDRSDEDRNVSHHVEQILLRMIQEKISGLIIDMRGNGGGSLEEVRRMTGLFIGSGPIVQVVSGNGHTKSLKSRYSSPLYTGPLVLLTDKQSASATEIFAAALQDYNRAVVIGASSTFGKGTVQTPDDISRFMPQNADSDRAGTLKYTIQKYYRASGGSVQLRGVVPDITLPFLQEAGEVGEQYADHALAFDIIRKAQGLTPFNKQRLFLPILKAQSARKTSPATKSAAKKTNSASTATNAARKSPNTKNAARLAIPSAKHASQLWKKRTPKPSPSTVSASTTSARNNSHSSTAKQKRTATCAAQKTKFATSMNLSTGLADSTT